MRLVFLILRCHCFKRSSLDGGKKEQDFYCIDFGELSKMNGSRGFFRANGDIEVRAEKWEGLSDSCFKISYVFC